MANPDLVVDTSIFIDHLRTRHKRRSVLFQIIDDYTLHTPTVVEFELFAGAINEEKRRDVHNLLQVCSALPMTSEIAREAGLLHQRLRRENRLIEIRDLFIASTALAHEFPLMTLNTKHFQRVEALSLVTPP